MRHVLFFKAFLERYPYQWTITKIKSAKPAYSVLSDSDSCLAELNLCICRQEYDSECGHAPGNGLTNQSISVVHCRWNCNWVIKANTIAVEITVFFCRSVHTLQCGKHSHTLFTLSVKFGTLCPHNGFPLFQTMSRVIGTTHPSTCCFLN